MWPKPLNSLVMFERGTGSSQLEALLPLMLAAPVDVNFHVGVYFVIILVDAEKPILGRQKV